MLVFGLVQLQVSHGVQLAKTSPHAGGWRKLSGAEIHVCVCMLTNQAVCASVGRSCWRRKDLEEESRSDRYISGLRPFLIFLSVQKTYDFSPNERLRGGSSLCLQTHGDEKTTAVVRRTAAS